MSLILNAQNDKNYDDVVRETIPRTRQSIQVHKIKSNILLIMKI